MSDVGSASHIIEGGAGVRSEVTAYGYGSHGIVAAEWRTTS